MNEGDESIELKSSSINSIKSDVMNKELAINKSSILDALYDKKMTLLTNSADEHKIESKEINHEKAGIILAMSPYETSRRKYDIGVFALMKDSKPKEYCVQVYGSDGKLYDDMEVDMMTTTTELYYIKKTYPIDLNKAFNEYISSRTLYYYPTDNGTCMILSKGEYAIVIDLRNGNILHQLIHKSHVASAIGAISNNGSLAAYQSMDNKNIILIWEDGELKHEQKFASDVMNISFTSNGNLLAVQTFERYENSLDQGDIMIIDVTTGKELTKLNINNCIHISSRLTFASNEKNIYINILNDNLKIQIKCINWETKETLATYDNYSEYYKALDIINVDKECLYATNNDKIYQYSVSNGQFIKTYPKEVNVYHCSLSSRLCLFSFKADNTSFQGGHLENNAFFIRELSSLGNVTCIDRNECNHRVGFSSGSVATVSTIPSRMQYTGIYLHIHKGPILSLAVLRRNIKSILFTLSNHGLYSIQNNRLVQILKLDETVLCTALASDGTMFVLQDSSKKIRFYDLRTNELKDEFNTDIELEKICCNSKNLIGIQHDRDDDTEKCAYVFGTEENIFKKLIVDNDKIKDVIISTECGKYQLYGTLCQFKCVIWNNTFEILLSIQFESLHYPDSFAFGVNTQRLILQEHNVNNIKIYDICGGALIGNYAISTDRRCINSKQNHPYVLPSICLDGSTLLYFNDGYGKLLNIPQLSYRRGDLYSNFIDVKAKAYISNLKLIEVLTEEVLMDNFRGDSIFAFTNDSCIIVLEEYSLFKKYNYYGELLSTCNTKIKVNRKKEKLKLYVGGNTILCINDIKSCVILNTDSMELNEINFDFTLYDNQHSHDISEDGRFIIITGLKNKVFIEAKSGKIIYINDGLEQHAHSVYYLGTFLLFRIERIWTFVSTFEFKIVKTCQFDEIDDIISTTMVNEYTSIWTILDSKRGYMFYIFDIKSLCIIAKHQVDYDFLEGFNYICTSRSLALFNGLYCDPWSGEVLLSKYDENDLFYQYLNIKNIRAWDNHSSFIQQIKRKDARIGYSHLFHAVKIGDHITCSIMCNEHQFNPLYYPIDYQIFGLPKNVHPLAVAFALKRSKIVGIFMTCLESIITNSPSSSLPLFMPLDFNAIIVALSDNVIISPTSSNPSTLSTSLFSRAKSPTVFASKLKNKLLKGKTTCWRLLCRDYPHRVISLLKVSIIELNTYFPTIIDESSLIPTISLDSRGLLLKGSSELYDSELYKDELSNINDEVTVRCKHELLCLPLTGWHPNNVMNHAAYMRHHPIGALIRENVLEAFDLASVRRSIDFKWQSFGRSLFLKRMYVYIIFLLCFTLATVQFGDEDYSDAFSNDFKLSAALRIILEIIVVLMAINYALDELQQIRKYRFMTYIMDMWNWFDLSAIILIATLIPFHYTNSTIRRPIQSMTAIILWFKVLHFARAFWSTGPFVKMIVQIVKGIGAFILLLVIIIMAFGHAYFLLFLNHEELAADYASWNILLKMYEMLLGDFSIDDLRSVEYSAISLILFILFTVLVAILMLNLLIALMSSIYEDVQDHVEAEWYSERAELILELERSISNTDNHPNKRKEYFPLFLHALVRTKDESSLEITNRDLRNKLNILMQEQIDMKKVLGRLEQQNQTMASNLIQLLPANSK